MCSRRRGGTSGARHERNVLTASRQPGPPGRERSSRPTSASLPVLITPSRVSRADSDGDEPVRRRVRARGRRRRSWSTATRRAHGVGPRCGIDGVDVHHDPAGPALVHHPGADGLGAPPAARDGAVETIMDVVVGVGHGVGGVGVSTAVGVAITIGVEIAVGFVAGGVLINKQTKAGHCGSPSSGRIGGRRCRQRRAQSCRLPLPARAALRATAAPVFGSAPADSLAAAGRPRQPIYSLVAFLRCARRIAIDQRRPVPLRCGHG